MPELDRLFWEPPYESCICCSTPERAEPALYEIWFELTGSAWTEDDHAPECVRHAYCTSCTAHSREEAVETAQGEYAMKLLFVRSLRSRLPSRPVWGTL